jgi:hypothetical protein
VGDRGGETVEGNEPETETDDGPFLGLFVRFLVVRSNGSDRVLRRLHTSDWLKTH